MADETPRHEPASEGARLPSDLAALDRRLETDAALWLTHLPATSRLDEHARALPARLAAARPAASTSGQSTTTITTTQHREPHMQTHIPTPPTRLRTLFAATAALVVVGAIAALLISLGARPSSPASGGPTRQTSQPGPQASHIAAIYTATDIDAGYNPVHVTSTFQKGQTVYVVMQVRGLPKGEQHFVNVSWLLNGKPLDLPPEVRTGSSIKGDSNTYFAVPYPQAGQGTAKIYWDLPNSDASSPEDLLAWTVNFTVTDGATPAPGDTPTPMPTPTLSGTQVPAPTPNSTPIPPTPTVSGPSATPTLPPPR